MPTLVGDIEFATTVLRKLIGFGLSPMPSAPLHLHRSQSSEHDPSKYISTLPRRDVLALCALAMKEYASMNLPLPSPCLLNATSTETELHNSAIH
jgi:hypothetical protein